MTVLYAFTATTGTDKAAFLQERNAAIAALEGGPRHDRARLHIAELCSYIDLQRVLLEKQFDVVMVGGDESELGLLETVAQEVRERFPIALAELLAASCRPGATVVLLACNTSHIGPELVNRGLNAIACKGTVDGNAFPVFMAGWLNGLSAGQTSRAAFDSGCRALLFEHWETLRAIRWYGPGRDVEGSSYEWLHPPDLDLYPAET